MLEWKNMKMDEGDDKEWSWFRCVGESKAIMSKGFC